MAEDAIPLKVFSQSALHAAPVFGGRLACNPVIDLAATVGDEGETLYIWRANQQVVAKYAERNQAVGAIRWKEDGAWDSEPADQGVCR